MMRQAGHQFVLAAQDCFHTITTALDLHKNPRRRMASEIESSEDPGLIALYVEAQEIDVGDEVFIEDTAQRASWDVD